MAKNITVDREEFAEHVKRICRSNIRNGAKICRVCPFRKHALGIMRENGWKLPEEGGCRITR